MKKTIIITLSMLCAFAIAAAVLSNQLTNMWQSPQQDSIDLSVSSPVEQVEKEYKAIGEYSYISSEEYNKTVFEEEQIYEKINFEIEPDMITYEQVAYTGGALLEQIFPQEEIADKRFIIYGEYDVMDKKCFTGVYKEKENYIIGLHYVYRLDAYSGKLMHLSRTKEESAGEFVGNNTQANEYVGRLLNICGYDEYIDFSVNTLKYYDGLLYKYEIKLDNDNVAHIQFDTHGKKMEIIITDLTDNLL